MVEVEESMRGINDHGKGTVKKLNFILKKIL